MPSAQKVEEPCPGCGSSDEVWVFEKSEGTVTKDWNMKKGEEQTIPIPQSQNRVEQLMEALEADRQTVEETSIEDLEAEIDRTVYDLFDPQIEVTSRY